ncbi:MAG: hypothetical protein ACOY46_12490 [Bacillota bacterium]
MRLKVFLKLLAVLTTVLALAFYARCNGQPPAIIKALPVLSQEKTVDILPEKSPGRVVLVIMDYLQLEDLKAHPAPNMSMVATKGAVALMNINTGKNITPENVHATIGAGSHAVAPANSHVRAYSQSSAEEEFLRRTGTLPPSGSLQYMDIARIHQLNQKLYHSITPGALGDKLHEAGYKTAALGNSDTFEGLKRHVLTIVMDSRGIVDEGVVSNEIIRQEREFTGGFSTDYEAILKRYKDLSQDVKLVAIDLGDLARLQDSRDFMEKSHWEKWRSKTIARSDSFLGELIASMDMKKDMLVLLSPTPGNSGINSDKMSPVLMYGGNISGGLIVSPTTKRPGVIMNVDIAPTVLKFLGIPGYDSFTGRPAVVAPGGYDYKTITEMYSALVSVYESRPYLHKGYVLFQLVLLGVSLGFIFYRKKGKEVLKPFFLFVMSVPAAYLLMPLLPSAGIPLSGLFLVAISVLMSLIFLKAEKRFRMDSFMTVSLFTVFVIGVDLLAGSPLQKVSIMSYDPIVGARFYGLGNEYMGVLIGAALVGTTLLIQALRRRRLISIIMTGAVYVFLLYTIAAPGIGTNVGGTIAASAAFLVTFLLICGVGFTWQRVVTVAAAVVLIVAAFTVYDSGRPLQCQSHIGRTAASVASGGLDEIINIVTRKSEINIKLIKYTIWSRIFLASLGILALLFYRPPGIMEGIRKRHPYIFKGLVGVVTGSIVALVFNDSGVVAAATIMIFGVPPLIYLVLGEMEGIQAGRV